MSTSHLLQLAVRETSSSQPLSAGYLMKKKSQLRPVNTSNVNPQEDVLEQLSQSVWLTLRRAACMGNWWSGRGMTLSLDSSS